MIYIYPYNFVSSVFWCPRQRGDVRTAILKYRNTNRRGWDAGDFLNCRKRKKRYKQTEERLEQPCCCALPWANCVENGETRVTEINSNDSRV